MKRVIRYSEKDSAVKLANSLKKVCCDNLVYFCIGSDRVLLDSLGPKIGTRLKERSNGALIVYGVEGNTINGTNLHKAQRAVKYLHPNCKILAIDASVDYRRGIIRIKNGGIRPGSGMGKDLGRVGNFSLVCSTFTRGRVVSEDYFYQSDDPKDLFYREPTKRFKRLQQYLNGVADTIADAILTASNSTEEVKNCA